MTQLPVEEKRRALLDIAPFKDNLSEVQLQIEILKAQSDHIILYSQVDPSSSFAQEVTHFADNTLFYLTDERFGELKDLPPETVLSFNLKKEIN